MIQVYKAMPMVRESSSFDRRDYARILQTGAADGDRWEECPVGPGPVAFIARTNLPRHGPWPGDDSGPLLVPYMDLGDDWEEEDLADVLESGDEVVHARGKIVNTEDGTSVVARWSDDLLGLTFALVRPFYGPGDPAPIHWYNPPLRYVSEAMLIDEAKDIFLAGLNPGDPVPSPFQLDRIVASIMDEVRADSLTIEIPEWMREQVARLAERDATRQGRNERCACGSGRKYKHCCRGRN